MAPEAGSSDGAAEGHILLEQPLLRLPFELVKANFKNTQRYIEYEKGSIPNALKDAANASLNSRHTPEQTVEALDAMIAQMQTFKRKLDTLHAEEETLHEHTSKRMKHVQELHEVPPLSNPTHDQWSRTRLDRLTVDYLLRSGYSKTAQALTEKKQISHLIDMDVFAACHKVAASLDRGEIKPALSWVSNNRIPLRKLVKAPMKTTPLEYELHLQQFIELVRANKIIEAREHATVHLSPQQETRPGALMEAAGLLAQSPETETEPYKSFFSARRWTYLSQVFIETHHSMLSLPQQPLLHVALSAGLSALKTPACHSAFNPTSSSTPGHAKMATNTSLCPICSVELNDLAKHVPYAHHTVSKVDDNPIMLPNGRIYGRQRLEELQQKLLMASGDPNASLIDIGVDGEVTDPTTGEKFGWTQCRIAFIT
ncbi:Protein FYV10 [Cyphellophora attinorum]|uniref:Protein FYV10 n=1 Tax=Cyphellophora attinorum TaxID=1664694 RepID=A0A0N1P1N9_9EURO|nr:Protein FYV10 [Phialophora attinorum]KPI42430.1 Protein FYV10 [Phialophora attinorum]